MPFRESRIRTGTFTLAIGAATPVNFAVPLTAVTITPNYDEAGDPVIFVDGSRIAADEVVSDTITLNFVQDFEDATGLQKYLWTNDRQSASFVWTTGTAAQFGQRFTGVVQLRRPPTGGEAGTRLVSEVVLPVIGPIVGPTAVV